MQPLDTPSTIDGAPEPLVPLRANTLDTPAIAASPMRLLIAMVGKLVAAHRARQAAAVQRALRSGLAAID